MFMSVSREIAKYIDITDWNSAQVWSLQRIKSRHGHMLANPHVGGPAGLAWARIVTALYCIA